MNRFAQRLGLAFLSKLLLAPLLLVHFMSFAAISGDAIQFRDDSLQQYHVVEGDTLWDISARFLEAPWLWPEIWQSNRQIVNPDLIYPGDIIELVYTDGRQMLTINTEQRESLSVIKLLPQIRREILVSPIQAISLDDINNALSRNRVMSLQQVASASSVVGTESGKRFATTGEITYGAGSWNSLVESYEIIRPEKELIDKVSGDVIGVEAIVIASATMVSQTGNQGSLRIDKSIQEVDQGDLIVPKESNVLNSSFLPKPPAFNVSGTVVDIGFGKSYGGARDTIILDLGEHDRIATGDLLILQKADHELKVNKEKLSFTGEKFGRVLIYQVFADYSLGFVLSSNLPINLDDKVVTP